MQISQIALAPEHIKMRWNEPYVTAGLNRKSFKTVPRGIYSGFVVKPGTAPFTVVIKHDDPEGYGVHVGYAGGAYDSAAGWSIAVHESVQGFSTTIGILASAQANYVIDLNGVKGQTVFIALHVDYRSGLDTTASIKVCEASDLELNPTWLVLARVDVPNTAPISLGNIIYDDAAYPRILPYASELKPGYMSKLHAQKLRELTESIESKEPAFTYSYYVETNGTTEVPLPPGAKYVIAGEDLWVFKQGILQSLNADYTEVDRGDGFGEKIVFVRPLLDGDVIKLRIQTYAAASVTTTSVFDEGALIANNVRHLNISGAGASVLPDGPNRVKVVIPGGGGSGGGGTRTKKNSTTSTIAQYRCVSIKADNTIKPFDPRNFADSLYGITLQAVPADAYSDIAISGVIESAAIGISDAVIGQDVYVADDGTGKLTSSAPDPMTSQVIKVGIFEGGNLTVTSAATDILIDKVRLA